MINSWLYYPVSNIHSRSICYALPRKISSYYTPYFHTTIISLCRFSVLSLLLFFHRNIYLHIFFPSGSILFHVADKYNVDFNAHDIYWPFSPGWSHKSRIHWSRCLSSQPTQNVLHSAWWRWSWYGSHWCEETLGTIFAITPCGMNSHLNFLHIVLLSNLPFSRSEKYKIRLSANWIQN